MQGVGKYQMRCICALIKTAVLFSPLPTLAIWNLNMYVTECPRMHPLSWKNGFQGLQSVFYFLFLVLQQMRFGSMGIKIFQLSYTRLPTCSSLSTYSLQKNRLGVKGIWCVVLKNLSFRSVKTSCLYYLCSMFALSRNWETEKIMSVFSTKDTNYPAASQEIQTGKAT